MATNGITTLGNRTFLFGGSSGIDTSALITAAYNQRLSEATKIDDKITLNSSKRTALEQMQTLGQKMQDALVNLKKNYSILSSNTSLFDSRTGTLSSGSATDPTSLVDVSIDIGTTLGSYDLEVVQKAKAHKVGSDATFTDKTSALNLTGGFDIGVAGGVSATINITSGMSLNDFAAAINAQSTTTGVSATVMQVSSSSFQLVLSGAQTNKEISISNVTGTDVMNTIGVTNGAAFKNVIQAAQPAIIKFDDVLIQRDTNKFEDIVTGVDLTVKNAEPGTNIQMNVTTDNSSLKSAIMNFVDAYNNMRTFVDEQQKVNADGTASENAVLFGDFMLKNMTTAIQQTVAGSYGSGGTTMSTLRELGLTVGGTNQITVDEAKLDQALINKFDEVRSIFETAITSDNSEFRMSVNKSRQNLANFAMNITVSGGNITDVSIGGDSSLFTISNRNIIGKEGTAYEGMTFTYIGAASTTVNVDMKQGFADLITNRLSNYTDILSGMIQKEKQSLDSQNVEMTTRSTRIRERAEDYRDRLIDKYGKFEAAVSRSQTILAQLRAVLGTNDDQ